tara:strand:+ start:658 stop:993 length:336 start_codon:yes stop_codon:yes gene_type:complete
MMRAKKKKKPSSYMAGGKMKKYLKGGKTGDPKKKKDDKSFTTLREHSAREKNRPTEEDLNYMLDIKNKATRDYLKKLPKVIKIREEQERRNPASGKPAKKSFTKTKRPIKR